MVQTPLVRPREFFRERELPAAFLPPATVVVLNSLLLMAAMILLIELVVGDPEFAEMMAAAEANATFEGGNATGADPMTTLEELPWPLGERWFWYALATVFVTVFGLGVWLAEASVLYLLTIVFDGSGQFGRLLLFVGWGYLPRTLYSLVVFGEAVFALLVLGPEAYWETLLLTDHLWPYLPVLVTLWTGYVWVFAVRYARNVTLKQAILTTALPVGFYVLLDIWPWLVW